ncbi:MAG TPA: PEP-CTERM sorting domain-containing protein [Fimbriimonadaceae bacterium]|nr:PEP-CTERM sorting domain-containing protein [Fimbriimonadaceae bacterium]
MNTPENRSNSVSYSVQIVPEPATMAALGLGVAALIRRRRK